MIPNWIAFEGGSTSREGKDLFLVRFIIASISLSTQFESAVAPETPSMRESVTITAMGRAICESAAIIEQMPTYVSKAVCRGLIKDK